MYLFKFIKSNILITIRFILGNMLIVGLLALILFLSYFPYELNNVTTDITLILAGSLFMGLFVFIDTIISTYKIIKNKNSIHTYFKTRQIYLSSRLLEFFTWFSYFMTLIFVLWINYNLNAQTVDLLNSQIVLLLFLILSILSSLLLFVTKYIEYRNYDIFDKININKTPIVTTVISVAILVIIFTFTFSPIINMIFFTPDSDEYPNNFDSIMDTQEFKSALSDQSKISDENIYDSTSEQVQSTQQNESNEPYLNTQSKHYNNLHDVFNGSSYTITTYVTKNKSNKDILNYHKEPTNKIDNNYLTIISQHIDERSEKYEQNMSLDDLNNAGFAHNASSTFMYQQDSEKNETTLNFYEYRENNKSNLIESNAVPYRYNADSINTFVEIEDRKKGMEYERPPVYENILSDMHVQSPMSWNKIMVSTGEKTYQDRDVIVYENLWNNIPSNDYISNENDDFIAQSVKVYIDKEKGELLRLKKENIDDEISIIYEVKPSNDTVEKPDFLQNNNFDKEHNPHRINYEGNKAEDDMPVLTLSFSNSLLHEYKFKYEDEHGEKYVSEKIENSGNNFFQLVFEENNKIKNYELIESEEITTSTPSPNGTLYMINNDEILEEIELKNYSWDFRNTIQDYHVYNKVDTTNNTVELSIYGFTTFLTKDVHIEYGNQEKIIPNEEWDEYSKNNPLKLNFDLEDDYDNIYISISDRYEPYKINIED